MTDPVTLAVVRGALEQITDEMDLHLIRAALSPIISETNDCAHGLYDPETGETIAQGSYGLPLFLASMQWTVQRVIARARENGGFRDGDLWFVNDPYISGTHLNDVVLVKPVFVDGELFALFANTGHWMDMGGSVPGGWAPSATEIHQEGLIIPPLKLCEEGRFNTALLHLIQANVRLPQQLEGDLTAMMNVFSVGARGLNDLIGRYGVPTLKVCIEEILDRSERQMRSYIADIPDGTYSFEDWFDNDGVDDVPLKVALTITVVGDDLRLDFSGTAEKARGPMNISDSTTMSMCLVAIKHVFPDVPINGGAFRPIAISIPQPSILAAQYPSPVGGTTDVTQRVVDVVFGALAQAIPDLVPAAPFGTTGVLTVTGKRAQDGGYFVAVYPYPGGYGASAQTDGLVNGTPPSSMARFMSVEMSEHRYPVRFEYLAIREESGGAGAHRGGCGTAYGIEALADCTVSILGDRVDYQPFGVQGGQAAAPNEVRLVIDGKTVVPPMRSKAEKVALTAGDRIRLASPGGGGFGDPRVRDVSAVEADLNNGLISAETASEVYGVVIAGHTDICGRTVYSLKARV
ncbi:MAG: hydantoinase B/oxoprolinase family protein [Novosphingobium sp.]|nr:hydantoinase B/oxoprolinase family protein [Novosphingobium sp.]